MKLAQGVLVCLLMVGCGALKTRKDIRSTEKENRHDESIVKEINQAASEISTDEPEFEEEEKKLTPMPKRSSSIQPPKVGVILGPGGAKALAHSGVLKGLIQARVPVDYVVGIEWGALVGALYAQSSEIHNVDWKLYKLNNEDFVVKKLFSSQFEVASFEKIKPFIKANLGSGRIEKGKVEFACPSTNLSDGSIAWQSRGEIQDVLERCMPVPPVLTSKGKWRASVFSLFDSVEYLKRRGVEVFVFVNVLGPSGDLMLAEHYENRETVSLFWHEVRRYLARQRSLKLEWIDVNTSGYRLLDFDKKRSIMSLGEQVGQRVGSKIAEKYGF